MATLVLALTMLLQVATPADMKCLGFIMDSPLPPDVFVAGTLYEGITTLLSEGQIGYLNGPGIASLKPGGIYRVVRPEGRVQGRDREGAIGIYYMSVGTIRIERLENEGASAVVLTSCQPMIKGDVVIPLHNMAPVEFKGNMSSRLTPFPEQGLTSAIVLGHDDRHTLSAGDFCFIGVGSREGVKPGDRFTAYRLPQAFEQRDLLVSGQGRLRSYEKIKSGRYDPALVEMLRSRHVPPRPLGDLVVVEVGEGTATARIVNGFEEITLGDLVVRR